MTNPPKTREEAMWSRYGMQPGAPYGYAFKSNCCAYEVCQIVTRIRSRTKQCSRHPGHGPANLYCKQHAKIVEGK